MVLWTQATPKMCYVNDDNYLYSPKSSNRQKQHTGLQVVPCIAWSKDKPSIGNENVPIQSTQCLFSGLAISNDKILIYFWNKIYGSNFIEQHSETVMVWNYRNADCSLRKNFVASSVVIFGTLSFPIGWNWEQMKRVSAAMMGPRGWGMTL